MGFSANMAEYVVLLVSWVYAEQTSRPVFTLALSSTHQEVSKGCVTYSRAGSKGREPGHERLMSACNHSE